MKVFRWDEDLALELPASVVEELELKEGDEIDLGLVHPGVLGAARKQSPPEPVRDLSK
jgi:antitoxin MazE